MTTEEKAATFDKLNEILGSWRDSSDRTITITQDECTQEYWLSWPGLDFSATSLEGVIEIAHQYKG